MAAAAVTQTLKLGTGICLLIQRDTILTAKAVACLDQLSGGRVLFGIGGGWNAEQMEHHGTVFKTRFQKMGEQVRAMKAVWTQDIAEFHGEFVNFAPIWCWPKPLQQPHPPVLLGGESSYTLQRSEELREFLSTIPSSLLQIYADQCLRDAFNGSGYALQDIINQAGRRLGFTVEDGWYRGSVGQIGYDGIWHFPNGHTIVVEVKTTDAYRIDLETIVGYRKALIKEGTVPEHSSSVLIIVGREDTGDLEAQLRGSRHARDMRLISVDALMRLMTLKEEVEDPRIIRRIYDILIPREFTKLDAIVEILFSTAKDVKHEEQPTEDVPEEQPPTPKFVPSAFHETCVTRVQQALHHALVKRTRVSYMSADGATGLICAVSRTYTRGEQRWFWFAFHPHQQDFLAQIQDSFVAFGCGAAATVLLIPFGEFAPWLMEMNITEREDRFYWHVHIFQDGERFLLARRKGAERSDLTRFLLPAGEEAS